nr:hybrid signal transduction histidine kinase M [Tanacetum cinerariifolium]
MELQEELRSLELGNLTISDYFKKLKMVSDLLSNLESLVDKKSLVMHAINGLGERYEQFAGIMRHKTKRPTLLKTRSTLLLKESRLNRRDARSQTRYNDTPSSSTVLMTTGLKASKGEQSLNPAHIAAARPDQHVMSQPTPQAFGPSGILGPHLIIVASVPDTTTPGRWVFEPYGDQPSYLPHAFNAISHRYLDTDSG